ncbi:PAS-domain containing protein [Rhodobacter sp. Har01]|uniref:PAS-domain containing protein n=1 Tax=Rhodobacter sp. Har01 TaxID=2883999 RepID=UPI001D071678|nr:PAS-domain containing protein [Rhodobacter sp. Har01]MCB6177902.1 PAS-domain containing protein [Rhodobacter sp. Har01]
MFDWTFAFGMVLTASLVALASVTVVSALSRQGRKPADSIFTQATPATVLLFDGDRLVDATASGRALLAAGLAGGKAWLQALARLEPMFPGLTLRLEGLQREGRFVLCSREDIEPPLVLRAENLGGLTRLTLVDSDAEQRQSGPDAAAELALREEAASMRDTLTHLPLLIWHTAPDGQVTWANGAYIQTAIERLEPGQDLNWPLPALFDPVTEDLAAPFRRSLRLGEELRWYELTTTPLDGRRLHVAQPVNKLVQAEMSLRDFMQTLTKTFAHLPIGLAIFDRNRVLQIFNPALIDLTGLPAEFLIGRPTLSMLLDAMREKSMLPEPKDYRSWRKQIVDLEEAAAKGLFEDTWSLPSGQTYRVTGRPHPNGALAFLFEDISSEMSRTRRYRADVALGRAVIDVIDQPVVVFAQDGSMTMANRAAVALWGPPQNGLGLDLHEPDAVATWRSLTAPTLLWNDLADYIGTMGAREPWDGEVRLKDGRLVECRVAPLPDGATMVTFRTVPQPTPALGETGATTAVMVA